jgi:hypothetical protein
LSGEERYLPAATLLVAGKEQKCSQKPVETRMCAGFLSGVVLWGFQNLVPEVLSMATEDPSREIYTRLFHNF